TGNRRGWPSGGTASRTAPSKPRLRFPAVVPLPLVFALARQAVGLTHEVLLGEKPATSGTGSARLPAFSADPPVVVGNLGHSAATGLANRHVARIGGGSRNRTE